jgi:hypothetical protein
MKEQARNHVNRKLSESGGTAISGRQKLEEAIRRKRGGIWLELTPEQYEKLREPS